MVDDDFWIEYEALADNAANASYRLTPNALRRWLTLLDSEPSISTELKRLESSMDFKKWLDDCEATQGGMIGSARLEFPIEKDKRLGAHLFLIRSAAQDERFAIDFGHMFLTTENNFEIMMAEFIRQVFLPLQAELRRHLERLTRQQPPTAQAGGNINVPASDRVVTLNHNSEAYSEAIEALNRVRDAVAKSNEYGDLDDKGQRIAELNASRVLLDAPQVRVSAVQELTVRCLKYLGSKFVDGVIGVLVTAAIVALAAVFGFHVLM